MSLLETISKPNRDKYMVTIVGESGMGKTSLAATFPKPIFIRTEDGFTTFAGENVPDSFPIARKFDEVVEQLLTLGKEDHEYETVVIDSVTSLNYMIESEVVASDGRATSINNACGGFGAGYSTVAEMHSKIKRICDKLNEKKKMNVVFIAHAIVEDVTTPEYDPYMRYTIRMHKKSIGHYEEQVDVVAFLKQNMFLKGDDNNSKNRAVTDGSRIVTCYKTPSHISKNRFSIDKDLIFIKGENPFAPFIKF